MTFNIAATVVDIRPNGNRCPGSQENNSSQRQSVGDFAVRAMPCRKTSAPDNVVLSKDVIDLEIRKRDRGHLRDGYKRGWFSRWLDRLRPF